MFIFLLLVFPTFCFWSFLIWLHPVVQEVTSDTDWRCIMSLQPKYFHIKCQIFLYLEHCLYFICWCCTIYITIHIIIITCVDSITTISGLHLSVFLPFADVHMYILLYKVTCVSVCVCISVDPSKGRYSMCYK